MEFAAATIIIYCLLAMILNSLLSSLCKLKIKKSKKSKESVKYRNIYKAGRITILLLYTFFLPIVFYLVSDNLFMINDISEKFIFIGVIGIIVLTYSSMSLPISSKTIEDIGNENFILFLRGFSSDNYDATLNQTKLLESLNPSTLLNFTLRKNNNPNDLPFSENNFYITLKKTIPVYCVGMTKEVASPHGCKRVYLDDESWKEGVSLLIKKAKYVFILIHNSESCVWEIKECEKIASEKTVYLIDTINKYEKTLELMKDDGVPYILDSQAQKIQECFTEKLKYVPDSLISQIEKMSNNLDKIKNVTEKDKEELFQYGTKEIVKVHCAISKIGTEIKIRNYNNDKNGLWALAMTIFSDHNYKEGFVCSKKNKHFFEKKCDE